MTASETCRICGKPLPDDPALTRYHPFCSARCKQVDLGRWFTGSYVIEEPLLDSEDDASSPASDDESLPGRPPQ